jgi:hypothetical protein
VHACWRVRVCACVCFVVGVLVSIASINKGAVHIAWRVLPASFRWHALAAGLLAPSVR